jgi:thiosulfate reductase cytochrome b subunit
VLISSAGQLRLSRVSYREILFQESGLSNEAVLLNEAPASSPPAGHSRWVRICHWLVAFSYLTLAVSGFLILMVHPRLYLGEVGNDLTPALIDLPISHNYRPNGLTGRVAFAEAPGAPVTADRTYAIFNENGWARSLHFLAAWIFVVVGLAYLAFGIRTRHLGDVSPRVGELKPRILWQDLKNHMRIRSAEVHTGPPYNVTQKLTYSIVLFVVLPAMVATGLTMSPEVTSAFPFLLDIFRGYQSARTIHFFGFAALLLFFIVHLAMVIATQPRRHLRAMILGN